MKDWLAKLAEQTKSDDEVLHEQIQNLHPEVLQEIAYELDPSSRPTQLDEMAEKIAHAQRMGAELAHEYGNALEKQAFIPLIAGAVGRLVAGQGAKALAGNVVKNVAKDAVVNKATSAVGNALRPSQPAGQAAGQAMGGGGFNYGGGKFAFDMKSLGRTAAGFMHRNPGAAVTLAGAGVGALMAPRDEHGNKQYLRGAMMGGGLAAGANALSDGRLGSKAMKMVTRQNKPIFGQGARRYMIESAAATRPGASPAAASAMAPKGDVVGGTAAMAQAPRAMSPEWQKAHTGVQEMMERQQLSNQFGGHPGMGAPMPAAQRVGNGFSFKGQHDPSQPWANVKVASPAGLILRAALMDKLAAGGPAALFSTKLSPSRASSAVMGGGLKGLQTASKSVTPPPIPRSAGGSGTFAAAPGPSPFAAAPRVAPSGGGLASVQNQLNSARSVAGGGPMMPSGGGSTIRAMPGSGW